MATKKQKPSEAQKVQFKELREEKHKGYQNHVHKVVTSLLEEQKMKSAPGAKKKQSLSSNDYYLHD